MRPSQTRKQRLTVSIQTRNSTTRIGRLLDEVYMYADEVIVGVDASSTDGTFDYVRGKVDVTYQFSHGLLMAPARLLVTEYATGDWILSLDDDESMESTFDEIRDELLDNNFVTHYHFPRKNLINLSPCEYLRALPFYPDWQLRLFRNDASILWKPPRVHTGYWVQGMGQREARANIVHFERLWCSPETRAKKFEEYRLAGDRRAQNELIPGPNTPRSPTCLRASPPPSPGIDAPKVHETIREPSVARFPGWKALFLNLQMASYSRPFAPLVADVLVRNIGTMAWTVPLGHWPSLNLTFRLLREDGKLLRMDNERFSMPGHVPPGREIQFLAAFHAPGKRGRYWLEWDLVSEKECWFQECGSETRRTALKVE